MKRKQSAGSTGALSFLASHRDGLTALGALLSPILIFSWKLTSSLADIKTQIAVAQSSISATQNSLERLERNQLLLQSDIRAVDSRVSSVDARVSDLSVSVAIISKDVVEGLKRQTKPQE